MAAHPYGADFLHQQLAAAARIKAIELVKSVERAGHQQQQTETTNGVTTEDGRADGPDKERKGKSERASERARDECRRQQHPRSLARSLAAASSDAGGQLDRHGRRERGENQKTDWKGRKKGREERERDAEAVDIIGRYRAGGKQSLLRTHPGLQLRRERRAGTLMPVPHSSCNMQQRNGMECSREWMLKLNRVAINIAHISFDSKELIASN